MFKESLYKSEFIINLMFFPFPLLSALPLNKDVSVETEITPDRSGNDAFGALHAGFLV